MTLICECLLPCRCDANYVADSLGVSPTYHQEDSVRWGQAALVYMSLTEPKPPSSPPNSPRIERKSSSQEELADLPPLRKCSYCSECTSPVFGNSRRNSAAILLLHKKLSHDSRRDSLPNIGTSMGLSLNKVGSLNRSLAGTNPASRGEQSLELEAIAAVHELSFAVQSISVSEMLPRTPDLIFVNVTTIEGHPYCLELTLKGWRITSLRSDCMVGDFTRLELFTKYYDSLYALMDDISPGYRVRFGEKLAHKLKLLQAGEDIDCVAPNGSYSSPPMSLSGGESMGDSTDSLPIVTPVSSPTIDFEKPIYA